MRYGDLTYQEIDRLPRTDTVVVLPLGCTEQQGPHLPVDFDTWFSESLMIAAANEADRRRDRMTVVLPAIPVGPTPEHRNFGTGYLHLPEPLHDQLVVAAISSILEQGFRHVVVWRGCGQHDLHQAVVRVAVENPGAAPDLDFAAYSDTGVIGDPRHASADLGDRLWRACVDWVADYLTAAGDDCDA
ncbi:hypothetical protein GCM10011575_46650 [Microlunatus endophyticus]|uniref:Creatinine amidohydrolase n=1 Tax=Microlunatus endophyticus TaxID=1716077 RepID=A0A917SIP8_9ACTN|nr:hypothetical protein GCM10011575_46650 [Microlunatus endophyticus]